MLSTIVGIIISVIRRKQMIISLLKEKSIEKTASALTVCRKEKQNAPVRYVEIYRKRKPPVPVMDRGRYYAKLFSAEGLL